MEKSHTTKHFEMNNSLFKLQKEGEVRADSRDVCEVIDQDHKRFFQNVILKNQSAIEEGNSKPMILLTEKTKGRPQRYALLTPKQLMIALHLTKATERTQAAIAYLVDDIMKKKIVTPSITPVWDGYVARMRPAEDMKMGVENLSEEIEYVTVKFFNETHFSPDEEIAKFLNSLETSLGYSLPFELNTRDVQSYVARTNDMLYGTNTAAEFEDDDKETETDDNDSEDDDSEYGNEDGDYNEAYYFIDENYDDSGFLFNDFEPYVGKVNSSLHVLVNEQTRTEELRDELLELADTFVKTENESLKPKMQKMSDEIKQHWNILGWGLQPHADFINWWQKSDNLPSSSALVYLDTINKIEQVTMPNPLFYEVREVNGKAQLVAKEEPPIFERLIIYPNSVKPLFDYYLEDVWYPQHALKWITSVDKNSVSLLQQGLAKAGNFKRSKLPPTFLTALQATLPEASKRQALR